MPKNTKGGKGHKRQKNSTNLIKFNPNNVPFRNKSITERQYYAKITATKGNRRFDAVSFPTDFEGPRTFLAHKSKSRKRGGYIKIGDIVLVSARDFATCDRKVDIIHKYNELEFDHLIKSKEIILIGDNTDESGFSFDRCKVSNDSDLSNNKTEKKKSDDLAINIDEI